MLPSISNRKWYSFVIDHRDGFPGRLTSQPLPPGGCSSRCELWERLLELLRKFVRAALDPVVRQFAVAHLPNGDAGVLHGTVISRCAEHASIETSDGPTGNNAAAINAAEHIMADQTWFSDFGSEGFDPFLECGRSYDVGSGVGDNEVLGTEAIDGIEVVRWIPDFGPELGKQFLAFGCDHVHGMFRVSCFSE
jgi:hypothetical protein